MPHDFVHKLATWPWKNGLVAQSSRRSVVPTSMVASHALCPTFCRRKTLTSAIPNVLYFCAVGFVKHTCCYHSPQTLPRVPPSHTKIPEPLCPRARYEKLPGSLQCVWPVPGDVHAIVYQAASCCLRFAYTSENDIYGCSKGQISKVSMYRWHRVRWV